MSLIVQKFGGSSVRSAARIRAVAGIIRDCRDAGHSVVAVLSAQGNTTDALLARARALSAHPPARELDALLATGEQQSAALCAMALCALGVEAVSLSAWQIPVETDGCFGAAEITRVGCGRIERELAAGRVVLVTGFQGVCPSGDVTTLGRGGSDTSAVALAAWLGAQLCQIYTDVDGVYTADPRLCPGARRLERLGYAPMRLLAEQGAQVLAARAAVLGERYAVPLEVRSCEAESVGTRIVPGDTGESVAGVTLRRVDAQRACVAAVGRAFPSQRLRERAESALAGLDAAACEESEQVMRFSVPQHNGRAALCALHEAMYG